MKNKSANQRRLGFTLIELMLVMGIIAILFAISTILLSGLIPKASFTAELEVLNSQLRQQQLKAMAGAGESESRSDFGVYFSSNAYTLFSGEAYDPAAANNFVLEVEEPNQLQTTFNNQQVVFLAGSGEVANFNQTNNTITIRNTVTQEEKVITINRYGVIDY